MQVFANFNKTIQRLGNEYILEKFLDLFNGVLIAPKKDGPWLCGGAIRDVVSGKETETDFDYFFKDQLQLSQWHETMIARGAVLEKSTDTNETFILTSEKEAFKIQAIKISYYSSIIDVLDSFDFTVCQFGWDGESLWCGDYSLWDLGRKRLAIHNLTYGVSTLRRLMKYSRKGFTICNGCLADVLQRTVNDPSTINSDIVYVD